MKLSESDNSSPEVENKQREVSNEKTISDSIVATVIFGMPTKDCSYNGICRIEPEKNYEQRKELCSGLAMIFLIENSQLIFRFKKDKMKQKTIKKHFGSGYFIIIEDFEIPEFVLKYFEQCTMVIPQGVYKIEQKEESYDVLFDTV